MPDAKPVAVVTGASSGIGSVYADRLAARGYDLVLVARRIERLRDPAETVRHAHGIDVETVEADLTTEAGLVTVEHMLSTNDRVTMLVNNAGNGKFVKIADMSAEDSAATIMLNIIVPTRLTQAVLPGLPRPQARRRSDPGAISWRS